jgi:hypothetical protein
LKSGRLDYSRGVRRFLFWTRQAQTAAGVKDLRLARAMFAATVKRRPSAKITLRNGAHHRKTWPADD